jgi:putative ABC transport system substrate-binding protein
MTEPSSPIDVPLSRHIGRRALVRFAVGAAIAWPLVARAQQKAMPVIGFLHFASPGPLYAYEVTAFQQGLG